MIRTRFAFGPFSVWTSRASLWLTLWVWRIRVDFGVGLPLGLGIKLRHPGGGVYGVTVDLGPLSFLLSLSGMRRITRSEVSYYGCLLTYYSKQMNGACLQVWKDAADYPIAICFAHSDTDGSVQDFIDAIETVQAGWKEPGERVKIEDGVRLTETKDGRLKAVRRTFSWKSP